MKRLPVKILLAASLCVGLLFYIPTFAANQEIDTLQQKIKEKQERVAQLEKSIAEYNSKIKQTQLQANSLHNQLSILDNRISEVQLDIEATVNTLAAIEYEIQRDNLLIGQKEASLKKQKRMLGEMLRTIHYNDNKNYLEIASNFENFSDFYNQVQYLKTVERDIYTSVNAIRLAKEDLERQKKEMNDRKLSYENVKSSLDDKKTDFKEQVVLKEDLLEQTHQSELTYKTLLGSLKSQHQQIEGEIMGIEKEVRKKLAEKDKLKNIDVDNAALFSWPVPSKKVTALFHDPDYPYRNVFEHSGIDIRASQGTPVRAAGSGYIAQAKRCSAASCYSYVMIVHSNGISTLYGHLSGIGVKTDQFVTRGDVIGYSGGTPGTVGAGPFVTGAHLHFEVRKNGIPTNPAPFLGQ